MYENLRNWVSFRHPSSHITDKQCIKKEALLKISLIDSTFCRRLHQSSVVGKVTTGVKRPMTDQTDRKSVFITFIRTTQPPGNDCVNISGEQILFFRARSYLGLKLIFQDFSR